MCIITSFPSQLFHINFLSIIVANEQRLCLCLIINAISLTYLFGGLDVSILDKGHTSGESDRGTGSWFIAGPERKQELCLQLLREQSDHHEVTESLVRHLHTDLCLFAGSSHCVVYNLMQNDAAFLWTLSIVIGGTRRLLLSPGVGGMFVAVCHSVYVFVCCWSVMKTRMNGTWC